MCRRPAIDELEVDLASVFMQTSVHGQPDKAHIEPLPSLRAKDI